MTFPAWLKTAWTGLLGWFSVEQQKLASFLYPVFQDAVILIKNDLLADIIDGVPVVAAALGGGIPAALEAAEGFILPVLEKQGVTLATTTLAVIKNALVAQAQASLTPGAAATAAGVAAPTA